MTLNEFKNTLKSDVPPNELATSLVALWYDAKGNWDQAHLLAQEVNDYTGAWVHGYLHRKEGDLANASYWYSRANKKLPKLSLEEEWQNIAIHLLKEQG